MKIDSNEADKIKAMNVFRIVVLLLLSFFFVADDCLALTKVDIIIDNYNPFDAEGVHEQQGYLRVGIIGGGRPPLLLRKGMYVYEGVIPDYINAISNVMKAKYSIFHFDSIKDANAALLNNNIDILAPSVPNDSTANSYSSPYYYDETVLVSNADSALHKDSYEKQTIENHSYDDEGVGYLNLRSSLAHLAYGNGEPFLVNESSLTYELNYNLRKKINVDKTPLKFELKLEVNHKNQELLHDVNEAIKKVPQDIKNKIAKKWEVSFKNTSGSNYNLLDKPEKEWLSQYSDVYILINEDTPPPILVSESGSYSGVVFDTLNYINKSLNKNIVVKTFNNKEAMIGFAKNHSNSFIVECDSYMQNHNKKFSTSNFFSSPLVLVKKNKRNIINTKTIAISTFDKINLETIDQSSMMKVREVPKTDDAFRLLQNGYVDGVISNQISYYFYKNNGYRDLIVSHTFPKESLNFSFVSLSETSIPASVMNKALMDISPEIINQIKKKWQIFHLEKNAITILSDYYNELTLFFFYLFSFLYIISQRIFGSNHEIKEITIKNLNRIREISKKESYLTKISHELRTPLSAIVGLLEIEVNNKKKTSENISLAWESGRHLLSLASNIIDLNKIELGFYKIKTQNMSLKNSIVKLVDLYQVIAARKNLKIYYDLEISNDIIIFDPAVLNQIIGNLLSNAIKFTETGEIRINIFQDGYVPVDGRAKFGIEICDTGVGISEEDQKRIFEPFEQVNTSNNNLGSYEYSSGLGLNICKELLSLVNGSITVDSAVGKGTVFTIFIEVDVSIGSNIFTESKIDITLGEKIRILIVDDHIANATLLTQQLSLLGSIVDSASSGDEAFNLWREYQHDVVITDCNMTGGNGFDLAKNIRAYELFNQLPRCMVIGLTASSHDVFEECLKSGMDDCLFKPLDILKLHSSLKKILITPPLCIKPKATSSHESSLKYITDVIECNTKDINIIKQAFFEKKYDTVYEHVHSLKGSALVSNHSSLVILCKSIEKYFSQGTTPPYEIVEELASEVFIINENLKSNIDKHLEQGLFTFNKQP